MTAIVDTAPTVGHAPLPVRYSSCEHGHRCAELQPRFQRFRCVELACSERLAGEAREFVGHTLCSWRCWPLLDPAIRVVSELATNALLHGQVKGTAVTRLYCDDRGVTFEIDDQTEKEPEFRLPGAEISGKADGWGLLLVDCLADAFGWHVGQGRKTVWARWELP